MSADLYIRICRAVYQLSRSMAAWGGWQSFLALGIQAAALERAGDPTRLKPLANLVFELGAGVRRTNGGVKAARSCLALAAELLRRPEIAPEELVRIGEAVAELARELRQLGVAGDRDRFSPAKAIRELAPTLEAARAAAAA